MSLEKTSAVDERMRRNGEFVDGQDVLGLPLWPTGRTVTVGCVDPASTRPPFWVSSSAKRRDPQHRWPRHCGHPADTRAARRDRAQRRNTAGSRLEPRRRPPHRLRYHATARYPDALAAELGVSPDTLDRESIIDPRASLAVDIAALRANPLLPPGLIVSGLLYDTDTGRLETVLAPSVLGAAIERRRSRA